MMNYEQLNKGVSYILKEAKVMNVQEAEHSTMLNKRDKKMFSSLEKLFTLPDDKIMGHLDKLHKSAKSDQPNNRKWRGALVGADLGGVALGLI